MNNDPKRLYKEVLIGLGGTHSAVYTEVSFEEYLAYTTEEKEKFEVMQLASQLDGNVEKAIKRIALEKREKKTISKNFKTNRNEKNLKLWYVWCYCFHAEC
jgi:protein subunit release factor A